MPFINYLLANPWRLLVAVLTLLALASLASYLAPSCERRKDIKQAAAAKAERQQAEATSQRQAAAYDKQHLLDSLHQVCLAQRAAALAQRDRELSLSAHPRLVLPAAEQLPREGAN